MKLKHIVVIALTMSINTMSISPIALAEKSNGIITLDPPEIRKRDSYSHGKLIPMDSQILITAGQVGSGLDGVVGATIEEQADIAMKNLYAVIKAAGMDSDNVLKLTIYYTQPEHLGIIFEARKRYFGKNFRPGSTAIIVKALAGPKLLVEVEAIAAKVR